MLWRRKSGSSEPQEPSTTVLDWWAAPLQPSRVPASDLQSNLHLVSDVHLVSGWVRADRRWRAHRAWD